MNTETVLEFPKPFEKPVPLAHEIHSSTCWCNPEPIAVDEEGMIVYAHKETH